MLTLLSLAIGRTVSAADLYAAGAETGAIYQIAPDGSQGVFSTVGAARGLAFDSAGNLYVADGVAFAIIKITPGGTQTTFASGLNDPRGIAFDAAGNLFVCNAGNNEILKFTPAGVQSTFVSGLNRPADVAFDASGNLFESDRLSGSILKFTPAGVQSTFATGLNLPAGLAFDSAGNLFEVDQGTATVMKFAPDGTATTFTTFESGDFPIRIAFDEDGNIYVSDVTAAIGPAIYKFTPDGTRTTFATEGETVGFLAFGVTPTTTAQPSDLLNISTRLAVGTDDNVLIAGFIITGPTPKTVIARAIGPSLVDLGIINALADPILELHFPDGSVITNDNWKDTQKTSIEASGLAPTKGLESAIIATLDPAAYTVIVRGVNNATGVGLVEVYDLDPRPTESTLANISTRGFVDTAENVMIAGFIIGGGDGGDGTVLVRGLGPSLTDLGVVGALANPNLELHDGDGNTVAMNEDWKDTQKTAITATTLAPTKDKECAILATVPPGAYTAILRGHLEETGVGLIEVFHLEN